jgi:hypothetical protein
VSEQAAVERTAHRQAQIEAAVRVTQAEMRFWLARLSPDDLMRSWLGHVLPGLYASLRRGQEEAARGASQFVAEATALAGLAADTPYQVAPAAFAGTAADGRPLTTLLTTPVLRARLAVEQRGQSAGWATERVQQSVLLMGSTEVADAGRGADQAAMAGTPKVRGYIRVVSAGACARCAILAGKWYRYNADFLRHPRCHCTGMPAGSRDTGRIPGWRTDPGDYFQRLSRADQDRLFGRGGAEAVRAGADIFQVVNARRTAASLRRLNFGRGRTLLATTEGTTRRGLYDSLRGQLEHIEGRSLGRVRLTPQAIFDLASDREELVRLLGRNGYLVRRAREIAAM